MNHSINAIVFYNGIGNCSTVINRFKQQYNVHIDIIKRYELDPNATALYQHNCIGCVPPDCIDIGTLLVDQMDQLNGDIWLITPPLFYNMDGTKTINTANSIQHVISLLINMKRQPTYILIQYDQYTDCTAIPNILHQCNYNVQQHTLCSTQYGYPNSRPHAYILAVQSSHTFINSTLPTNPTTHHNTIQQYLDDSNVYSSAHYNSMNTYLQSQYQKQNFDVVNITSTDSHTFTCQYGRLNSSAGSIIGYSNGFISLITGQSVRYFSVNEIQRLLGHKQLLNIDRLEINETSKYSLICTSANIDVLYDVLHYLLDIKTGNAHTAASTTHDIKPTTDESFCLDLPFTVSEVHSLAQLNHINTMQSVEDTNRLFSSIDPYTIQQQITQLQQQLHSIGTDDQWIQCIQCNNYTLVDAITSCYCNIPCDDDVYDIISEILWLMETIQPEYVSELLFNNIQFIQLLLSQITTDRTDTAIFNRLRLLYFIMNDKSTTYSKISESALLDCMSQLLALIKHSNPIVSCAACYCILQLNTIYQSADPLIIYLYTARSDANGWSILSQEIVELVNTGCMHISQLQSNNDTRTVNDKMIHYALSCVQQMLHHAINQHDLPCMYTTDLFVLINVMITHINEQSHRHESLLIDYMTVLNDVAQWNESKKKPQVHSDIMQSIKLLSDNSTNTELMKLCNTALQHIEQY